MIQLDTQRVTIFQSALYMTTSTIVKTDEAIFLVDPNWLPNEVEAIKKYVDNILLNKKLFIIYTHSDFDHIISSGIFENAIVIASDNFQNRKNKELIEKEIKEFDNKYYINRSYTPSYPVVNIVIKETRQQLKLKDVTLTFYLAPGHTADSMFTIIEPYGVFLSGDYLSDVEFPFINSSYEDYVQTMQLATNILNEHSIKLQIPGHGHATMNLREINDRIDFSQWYLQQLKEQQIDLLPVLKKKYIFFDAMIVAHEENIKYARIT